MASKRTANLKSTKTVEKLPPFVEVTWLDTVSDSNWQDLTELPKPIEIRSRGWLIEDEKKHVTIIASIGHWKDGTLHGGDITTVPRGCVVSVKTLRLR